MSGIEELLMQIKECCPKFTISKENLERPTQEFVVRFYDNMIQEYYEKIYLKGIPGVFEFNVPGLVSELEPEERLFLQLSKFFRKIEGLRFELSDIYQPTRVRTKNFFKVFVHFVSFIECLQNETDVLENKVFTTEEKISKLLMDEERLTHEINEIVKDKAELTETQNLLKQECKSLRNTYQEVKTLKTAKDKLYAEKRNQIENLKQELQNEEYASKRLENEQKDLSQRRITETEHQNILQNVKILKSESETLDNDDIDIEDGLKHENEVLQHNEDCLMILDKCDFNIANVKQLIRSEDDLKIILNTVDMQVNTKLNPVKQQVLEKDQKLMTLQKQLKNLGSDFKNVKDIHAKNLSNFSQELNKLKSSVEEKSQSNSKIISDFQSEIEKLKEDLNKCKTSFEVQYVKVSKIEKKAADEFKELLIKKNKELD